MPSLRKTETSKNPNLNADVPQRTRKRNAGIRGPRAELRYWMEDHDQIKNTGLISVSGSFADFRIRWLILV